MKTDSPLFPYRLYLIGAGAIALIVTLLRTLALCLTLDADIGYFNTTGGNGVLVGALYTVTLLGVADCFSLPFLLKRNVLPEKQRPLNVSGHACTCLCALAFIAATVYLFLQMMGYAAGTVSILIAPAPLLLLAAVACAVAALYFLLQLLGMEQIATPCGYGVILGAILLLSVTYFDRYTQMNAPHKVWVHLSLLSIMIYMLYELRARIDRPSPRAFSVTAALCFILCASTGVSDLVAYIAGLYNDAPYLICDLILTAFAAYVACRTISNAREVTAPETEEAE